MTVLIKGSVGHKGKNYADDVAKIRGLLVRHYKWAGKIAAKGSVDSAMIKAIENGIGLQEI